MYMEEVRMAFFDSSRSRFTLDDTGGVERDLSAYITDISGLPGTRTLEDITSLGDAGRKFIPSSEEAEISISGVFDNTRNVGPDVTLGTLRTHHSAVGFGYAPHGTASGSVKYSGKCWVETYEVSSSVGRLVQFTAKLKVNGKVSRGSY